jgi:hypothetical protein
MKKMKKKENKENKMKRYKSIFFERFFSEGYPDRSTAENIAIEEMEKALN